MYSSTNPSGNVNRKVSANTATAKPSTACSVAMREKLSSAASTRAPAIQWGWKKIAPRERRNRSTISGPGNAPRSSATGWAWNAMPRT